MYSQYITVSDGKRLRRSMVTSVIMHLVLIIVISICIATKPKETSPKLLQVSLKTRGFEENKVTKKEPAGMTDKEKLAQLVPERDRMTNQESADISATGLHKDPSVSPQVGKEEKREVIGIEEKLQGKSALEKVAAIQNDVSRDKAKFPSYAETYFSSGKEKNFNFIIDFSFSSNDIKKAFFLKYDIMTLGTLIHEEGECSKHAYYEIKYGNIPGIYVGEEYVYLWPKSVNSMFWEKIIKEIIEKYPAMAKEKINHFLAVRKLMVVFEIDEKKLEFRVREFSFHDIN